MSTQVISSLMTSVSIATQTPMKDMTTFGRGQRACHFFWLTNLTYTWKLVTSGVGMAVYRLLCFHYLFKRELNTKSMAKNILIIEWTLIGIMILANVACFNMFGWEKAVYYQFCMDIGDEQVEALHNHNINEFDNFTYKILRQGPGSIVYALILTELLIYLWLLYHLWKHDNEKLREKIITKDMKNERQQKNVVTLKGQVISFAIEIGTAIYISVHTANFGIADASVMSMIFISSSTVLSVVQLVTSHEMVRFVRSHFNLF